MAKQNPPNPHANAPINAPTPINKDIIIPPKVSKSACICGWWEKTECFIFKKELKPKPRECTGHSKYLLSTTLEMTLHMEITRWSILKSD